MSQGVLVLRRAEIREVLDLAACIDAVEAAFAAYSSGSAELPAVIHLDVPEQRGEIHVKAGHIHGQPYYATKFASGFPGNPKLGLPASDGLVVVFDAVTGAPAALLLDGGYISDLRTGAAGGVVARHLAPEEPKVVAIVGTGAQARHQLDALCRVRSFRQVRVWGRNADHARRALTNLRQLPHLPEGCEVVRTPSVRETVEGADVVVTCTASREPLVRDAWLKDGVHVTALGSDGTDKQELEPELVARADVLVCDSVAQCSAIGELHHAIEAGVVDGSKAVELGDICAGRRPGRTAPEQLTICDLTGVGVQDVAAALVVMSRAVERGLGERLAP